MRESVGDSGYGHEDISCVDIHVGILLECVFFFWINACALRWKIILVGDYYYWALLTQSWDPPFRYTRRRCSLEAVSMKEVGL